MTIAALCGVLGSGFTGSLFVGAVAGLVAGTVYTMLLAYFIQHLKANQVITGSCPEPGSYRRFCVLPVLSDR